MPAVAIHLLSLALCLTSGFQQGYIASVLNQPYKVMKTYINDSWIEQNGSPLSSSTVDIMWSFLGVCFPISTIAGQFIAAGICDRIGRKRTALLATFLYIPGSLLSAAAKWIPDAFELLYAGRIIWAIGNGIAGVVATVWIVECAPPAIRGRMAAMQEFAMAVGSLSTQAFGIAFSTESLWPLMFLPNVIVCLVNIGLLFFIHDSPQFILSKRGNVDEARKALAAYHGTSVDDPSLDSEMRICEEAIEKKRKKSNKVADTEQMKKVTGEAEKSAPSGISVMLNPCRANDEASQVVRQAAWVGLMVKIAYVFTGARALRAYSSYVLFELGGWTKAQADWGSLSISLLQLLPFADHELFNNLLGEVKSVNGHANAVFDLRCSYHLSDDLLVCVVTGIALRLSCIPKEDSIGTSAFQNVLSFSNLQKYNDARRFSWGTVREAIRFKPSVLPGVTLKILNLKPPMMESLDDSTQSKSRYRINTFVDKMRKRHLEKEYISHVVFERQVSTSIGFLDNSAANMNAIAGLHFSPNLHNLVLSREQADGNMLMSRWSDVFVREDLSTSVKDSTAVDGFVNQMLEERLSTIRAFAALGGPSITGTGTVSNLRISCPQFSISKEHAHIIVLMSCDINA